MHWLEKAFVEGLYELDLKELMKGTIEHNSVEGVWETGVVSPSLVGNDCRLQRLKKFMGHAPQPGMKRQAARQGQPDAVSVLNFLRGFLMEGVIVTALREILGEDRIIGNAPELVFRVPYRGDDPVLNNAPCPNEDKGGDFVAPVVFAGHPDLLVWSPRDEMELVQIKCPSIFKLERVVKMGKEDALRSYRAQMATELYIGRAMGYPIVRTNLMLATWESTPRMSKIQAPVIPMDWDESLALIPEEVARELILDYWKVFDEGKWPTAEPAHKWDDWPCSYCQYSRVSTFDTIGCTEPQEWDRHDMTGETRVTLGEEPPPKEVAPVIPIQQRRKARVR